MISSDCPEARRPGIFVRFRDCVVFDCFQPQVEDRKRDVFGVETFALSAANSKFTNALINTSLKRGASRAEHVLTASAVFPRGMWEKLLKQS